MAAGNASDFSDFEISDQEEGEIVEEKRTTVYVLDHHRVGYAVAKNYDRRQVNTERSSSFPSSKKGGSLSNLSLSPVGSPQRNLRPVITKTSHGHKKRSPEYKKNKRSSNHSSRRERYPSSPDNSTFEDFDQMAKRFKNRFQDEPTHPNMPSLSSREVHEVPDTTRVHKTWEADAAELQVDLDTIPLPMDISDGESGENYEELEEDAIRMKLALLRSVADQNDPEIASRFADIQKLLDGEPIDDDDIRYLDEIPLPVNRKHEEIICFTPSPLHDLPSELSDPAQEVELKEVKKEKVDLEDLKRDDSLEAVSASLVESVLDAPGSVVIKATAPTKETIRKRKNRVHLFRVAKDRVDQAFRSGWNEFGSLFQDTVHRLKAKKIRSEDDKLRSQLLIRCAASVIDHLLEKKEFIPPWILKVRESSKTVQEDVSKLSEPVHDVEEEEDETSLREAVMKSLAERRALLPKPDQPLNNNVVLPSSETKRTAEEVPEEDIELMRAMLLVEVSRKARTEADDYVSKSEVSKKMSAINTTNMKVPKIKPVIIQGNPQSDDDCDWGGESSAEKAKKCKEEREKKFANVLASAKKIRQQGTENMALSDENIKLLPANMQHEYHLLKRRLNLLGKKRKARASQHDAAQEAVVNDTARQNNVPETGDCPPVVMSDVPSISEELGGIIEKLKKEGSDVTNTLDKTIGYLKELAAETEKVKCLDRDAQELEERISELQRKLAQASGEKTVGEAKKKALLETVIRCREELAESQKKFFETEKFCSKTAAKTCAKNLQIPALDKKAIHEKFTELRSLCANLKSNTSKRKSSFQNEENKSELGRQKPQARVDIVSRSENVMIDGVPTEASNGFVNNKRSNPASPYRRNAMMPRKKLSTLNQKDGDKKVQNSFVNSMCKTDLPTKNAQVFGSRGEIRPFNKVDVPVSTEEGKENRILCSLSASFCIDPYKIVCPHDLHGVCKDDQCCFQHLPRPSN